jgi:hypothetical protein
MINGNFTILVFMMLINIGLDFTRKMKTELQLAIPIIVSAAF